MSLDAQGSGFRYGFINRSGKLVIPLQYAGAQNFSQGLAVVRVPNRQKGHIGRMGYIDRQGQMVIPARYYLADSFAEGLAAVQIKENGRWGFIDKQGRQIIASRYDHAWGFSEGLAAVVQNGKVGYIDRRGRMVIAARYEPPVVFDGSPCSFFQGLAYLEERGYIGRDGTEYFEP